jgi:hypothetical protein
LFLATFASALVAQVDSLSARHYFRPNSAAGLDLSANGGGGSDAIAPLRRGTNLS